MAANSVHNERLSIKNLLFTKAIPNYSLPIPTEGRSFFSCKDCGDKFIIKSSYEYHINRKSLKITYFCRHCNTGKVFFNRCDLLSHIRSHAFKTATINIGDLKIEPLPLSYYSFQDQIECESEATPLPMPSSVIQDDTEKDMVQNKNRKVICFDCKENIFSTGTTYKDRAKHYTKYQNVVFSCPICFLTVANKCALEAHLRFHLRQPPYFCCDCGMLLKEQAALYPFTHYCESFKMMRATAKLKCSVNNCKKIFHPSECYTHLRSNHLKSVFKCSICCVACYKWENMQKHLDLHNDGTSHIESKKIKHIDFLQCEMCPGKLIIPNQIVKHLKGHVNKYINSVYPCWTCGAIFELAKHLIDHQQLNHPDIHMVKTLGKVTKKTKITNLKTSKLNLLCRTSNNYDRYGKNGVSQCRTNVLKKSLADSTKKIVCNLCQITIVQDWNIIKEHFAVYHKEHVCLEAKVSLKRMCHKKKKINRSKKHNTVNNRQIMSSNVKNNCFASETSNNSTIVDKGEFVCNKCGQGYENKQDLEEHIVDHRDPFMAYQCMECGESFIAKPSFSTHLLVKHGIDDVNKYIDEKKCYSKESLNLQKSANKDKEENEPIKENQCNICREQFSNSTDFEKHFRIHGMAFLMKTTNKPTSPDKL